MFAFPVILFLVLMAWPRHILDRIIHENLDYIRPRATHKQETLIRELENMLTVPHLKNNGPTSMKIIFLKAENGKGVLQK